MSFIKKVQNVARKGLAQSALDATMSAVDKVRAGEDGPSMVQKFIRDQGYSGQGLATTLKAAEPLVGSDEIEYFWSAWSLEQPASPGWHPQRNAHPERSRLTHWMKVGGRILVISGDGETVFELHPESDPAPSVSLVDQVTFSVAYVDIWDNFEKIGGRVVKARRHLIGNKLGINNFSPNQVYARMTDLGLQLGLITPSSKHSFEEYPGALVTFRASGMEQPFSLIVLETEAKGIVEALSTCAAPSD